MRLVVRLHAILRSVALVDPHKRRQDPLFALAATTLRVVLKSVERSPLAAIASESTDRLVSTKTVVVDPVSIAVDGRGWNAATRHGDRSAMCIVRVLISGLLSSKRFVAVIACKRKGMGSSNMLIKGVLRTEMLIAGVAPKIGSLF